MTRISCFVGAIVLVFGSLLTFPEYLPWVVSVWVVLALLGAARGQPMWPWLVGCVAIVSMKRPGFTLEFWSLILACIAVSILDRRAVRGDDRGTNRNRIALYALALALATIFFGASRWYASNTSVQIALDTRPIACLGDSLTDYGYPQELEKRLAVPVADFGRDGIKTDDGIEMVPEILAVDPQLVVIELGGHDYNADRKPRSATMANLEALVKAFQAQGIAVILVEIPRGFVSDPYDGMERELAAQYDLQLIDDSLIRSFVFNSPILPPGMWLDSTQRLSDDGLHPNALGNRRFAEAVCQALVKVYGDSVLR